MVEQRRRRVQADQPVLALRGLKADRVDGARRQVGVGLHARRYKFAAVELARKSRSVGVEGREVFAVPGPADAPYSQGPLDLLENGARLVRHADDILKELGVKVPVRGRRSRTLDLQAELPGVDSSGPAEFPVPWAEGSDQAKVMAVFAGASQASLEDLGRRSGLGPGDLAVALTQLELMGAVEQKPGALVRLAQRRAWQTT